MSFTWKRSTIQGFCDVSMSPQNLTKICKKQFITGFFIVMAILMAMGCSQPSPTAPLAPTSDCSQGEAEIIWPKLEAVQPEQAFSGAEVRITASGGYMLECDSFYNESHRVFDVFIDQEPFGTISCMSNHCEASLSIPDNVAPGKHTIMVAGGSQIEIEILGMGSLDDTGQEEIFPGTPLPTSVKGYELYSWRAGDGWHFTLITGTNRHKNLEEIVSEERVSAENGWVKITVQDIQSLKLILGRLPGSEQIFWLDGKLVESSNGPNIIHFPPKEIIEQVLIQSAAGIKFGD